jgi:hypothetical protein
MIIITNTITITVITIAIFTMVVRHCDISSRWVHKRYDSDDDIDRRHDFGRLPPATCHLPHTIRTHHPPNTAQPVSGSSVINNNSSFRQKSPGVPGGCDGSDRTSYLLTDNYTLPVAQATGPSSLD